MRVLALAIFLFNSEVESHITYGEILGDSQWNYEGSTSMNLGMGLMNPMLKDY